MANCQANFAYSTAFLCSFEVCIYCGIKYMFYVWMMIPYYLDVHVYSTVSFLWTKSLVHLLYYNYHRTHVLWNSFGSKLLASRPILKCDNLHPAYLSSFCDCMLANSNCSTRLGEREGCSNSAALNRILSGETVSSLIMAVYWEIKKVIDWFLSPEILVLIGLGTYLEWEESKI